MNTYEKGARAMFGALVLSTSACAPAELTDIRRELLEDIDNLTEAEQIFGRRVEHCRSEYATPRPSESFCRDNERSLIFVQARKGQAEHYLQIVSDEE